MPEALNFITDYILDGWFPAHQEKLEELSVGYLLGKVDMEFKSYLKSWWAREKRLAEARAHLAAYFHFYNEERLHETLGYRTPHEVYFGTSAVVARPAEAVV